jgi:hypothetical protein
MPFWKSPSANEKSSTTPRYVQSISAIPPSKSLASHLHLMIIHKHVLHWAISQRLLPILI